MQFRLISLMLAMTLVAVACGIVFAAPQGVAVILVCLIVLISPGFWIAGSVSARGLIRAFFIGGLLSGVAPFIISAYAIVFLTDLSNWFMPQTQMTQGSVTTNITVSQGEMSPENFAVILFSSGIISCLGGGLSMLTSWLLTRQRPTEGPCNSA